MSRRFLHSLRFRLTLWNTVVVLLAAVIAMLAVREGMRLTLEQEARSLLKEETTELARAIQQHDSDYDRIKSEFQNKIISHQHHGWFARLTLDDQSTIWSSSNFPVLSDSFHSSLSRSTSSFSNEEENGYVLIAHTFKKNNKNWSIILGEPTTFIKNDVWKLTKIMLWIGAGLALIAPLGGYFLARHATQPVRDIIKTTRELEPEKLDRRLPIRGTGDELDQISTEINSFVDQISSYLESHQSFIANAAHELRSPLAAIQTSVDVTLTQDRSAEEYRDELETVSEHCQQLRHLVNQLLDLAETDAKRHQANFQTIDLAMLIKNSADFFACVSEEKQIEVKTDLQPDVRLVGDESKIRQVVNNLLDNALKFTPPCGQVSIELRASGIEVRLMVRDSGPGVPLNALSHLFERFYQVDISRNRGTVQGNGLGLSICKSIVELHGGSISACNATQPSGFTVEIKLPSSQ